MSAPVRGDCLARGGVGERVQVLRVRGCITIEQIERVLKERRNRTI